MVVLFLIPLDKNYAYHLLKNECNEKGPWIHDRIFLNPKDIDVAFIGSSRTKASCDDVAMEDSLRKSGADLDVVNLGYCRWGRNMDYAIIKDLFRYKKVQYLVLELHEEEEYLGHIDFAYIADSRDVLMPVVFFNQNIVKDMYHAFLTRFDILKHRYFYPQIPTVVRGEDHGYIHCSHVADTGELAAAKRRTETYAYRSTALEDRINNRFPLQYLEKISKLAKENGCTLFFLYLPGYGAKPKPAGSFDYCKQYGTVFEAPRHILDEQENWIDAAHLNDKGALQLSYWLVGQMGPYIKANSGTEHKTGHPVPH